MPSASSMPAALLLAILCASGCIKQDTADGRVGPVQVFAAASTVDVMGRLAALYSQRSGLEVQCNFAGSSTLARQIESGAQADLFVSAHPEWVARLAEQGCLEPLESADLVSNQLVLIAPRDRPLNVRMQPDFDLAASFEGPLALADPGHVPAGRYAREALQQLGWWAGLEPRVLAALDVRHALMLVEMGECNLGVVYASDVQASTNVEVVGRFPELHAHYSLAVCRGASRAALDFAAFLRSEEALQIFLRFGFSEP